MCDCPYCLHIGVVGTAIPKFSVRIPSPIDPQVLLYLFQLLINVAESGLNNESDGIKYGESGKKGGVDVKTLH
jgi:hypothetical protein